MELKTFRVPASPERVAERVRRNIAAMNGDARAVLLATSGIADQMDENAAIVRAASEAAQGLPIVGMTSSGAHFTENGPQVQGVAGGVLGGADVSVASVAESGLGTDATQTATRAVSQISKGPRRGHTVLCFADGLACDGNELAEALRSSLPMGWRAVGGMAGDDWTFKKTLVFHDARLLEDSLVLLYINGDKRVSPACTNGYRPIPGANDLKVTEVDGRGIKALDGKPAFEAYSGELVRSGIVARGEETQPVIARYPLGFSTPFGEGVMIRTPLSVQDDGTVGINAGIRSGDIVRVMEGNTESVMQSAEALSKQAAKEESQSAVVFDCGGRREIFRDRYPALVEAFAAHLPGVPMLGITTYGEIAVYGGQAHPFHNYTAVMGVW